MSLDVSLRGEPQSRTCACNNCGHEHEVVERPVLFCANITHNLNRMAAEAGIYEHVWRPDEIGVTTARQLVEPLRAGIARMKADPFTFRQFQSRNGWGTYDGFVSWLERYLAACEEHPEATVKVSR